jgi:MraZ protein
LINKRKLKFAGISQDVRFLAVDDHIEVWDKSQFESVLSESANLGADLQEIMAELPPNLI